MTSPHPILAYLPQLRRYARALTGNETAADDLVQDTVERSLKKFELWQPGTDLRAWLFSVMHNVHINQVRSRHETESLNEEMEIPINANQGESLRIRDLSNALLLLPVEQREVLLLVGLEGMRYEEISQTLGVPIGTVMSRLSRGRERLHILLEGNLGKPNLKVAI